MFRFRSLLLSSLAVPLPLVAQEVPATPTPTATPTPMIVVTLPTPTPTPDPSASPAPTPTATPRALETPAARPSPRAAPTSRPTATPAPIAPPATAPTPAVVAPAPVATASPSTPPVIASPLPTTDDRQGGELGWPWMLGAGLLLVGGIGVWLARRQRSAADEEIGGVEAEPEVVAVPPLPPAPPVVAALAATLSVRFRPTRVGFNMLSATVEGELTVVNEGPIAASDVRVRTGLLGAHAGQDADLADLLAQPMGRPVVPAFALAPGEERTLRVVAAVAREAMRTLTAAGRPMFVPVLVADVRVDDGTQVAQGFAVGAERVDSAKLAPFWLDVPDRAYGEVAARAHGPAVVRRG